MDAATRKKIRNHRDNRKCGRRHRKVRAEFAKHVDTGRARCAKCGGLIEPGSPWDAGHDEAYPHLCQAPSTRAATALPRIAT